MKKISLVCGLLISALVMMTSCSKSLNEGDLSHYPDYIPFKLDEDGDYGLLGRDGKILFSDEFSDVISCSFEGVFVKGTEGDYSLYKAEKKPVLIKGCEELYDVGAMQEGLIAITKKNERISFIDKEGDLKFTLNPYKEKEIVEVGPFSDGLAFFKTEDDKCGFIDKNGKEIKLGKNLMPYRTLGLGVEMPNELCLKVDKESDGQRTVLIDKEGKVSKTFPKKVEFVADLQKDNYIFRDNEYKFGLNNSKDETIIRAKYEQMQRLSNGNFLVAKSNDKYDIINEKDEPVKSFNDDYSRMIYYPEFGLILAKTGTDKYELLDVDGEKISQDEFIIRENALRSNSKNYAATSDYFNADELAQKIVSVLTAKGMGKLSIGETFAIGNPENHMLYQKSLYNFDREEAGININILPQKGYIDASIEATDYIVNYNDKNKIQFNPEAKINKISLDITLRDFKASCEVVKSIIKNLKAKGHKELVSSEYCYVSYKDNIALVVMPSESGVFIMMMEEKEKPTEADIKEMTEEFKKADEAINEELKSENSDD